jgi:hypothetical protein
VTPARGTIGLSTQTLQNNCFEQTQKDERNFVGSGEYSDHEWRKTPKVASLRREEDQFHITQLIPPGVTA